MRTRRPWLLISSIAMALLSVTVVVLWWYLPIAAPGFVFRHWPTGEPAERAVVSMAELLAQGRQEFAQTLSENHERPTVITGLVRALEHPQAGVRLAVIDLVVKARTNEFFAGRLFQRMPGKALVARLRDVDPRIRLRVVTDLRFASDPGTVDPDLMRAVARDPDAEVRMEVARYVRNRRLPAIAAVMLDDHVALIRELAVDTVGGSKDPTWIPPLVHLFSDPEPRVRIAAAKALGDIEDERALPGLIEGLRSADPAVREAMVGALGRIEDIRALPPLIACLTDAEMTVRRAAANALGVIGDPRAIPALALCSAKDADRSVRCAAVSALDVIKDPAVLDPLMKALHDPDAVVRAMAEAAIARRP